MSILKTARHMGLYQDLACVSVPGEGSVAIPEALLQRAVASSCESLQVDALQLACVHPKATRLPGAAYTHSTSFHPLGLASNGCTHSHILKTRN